MTGWEGRLLIGWGIRLLSGISLAEWSFAR